MDRREARENLRKLIDDGVDLRSPEARSAVREAIRQDPETTLLVFSNFPQDHVRQIVDAAGLSSAEAKDFLKVSHSREAPNAGQDPLAEIEDPFDISRGPRPPSHPT